MNARMIVAGLNGFLAIAFAAFGAHALPGDLAEGLRRAYESGAQMHLVHAAALAALCFGPPRLRVSFIVIAVGEALFCGSLYAYALTAMRPFAMAAPLGGLTLMTGWLALAWAGVKARNAVAQRL